MDNDRDMSARVHVAAGMVMALGEIALDVTAMHTVYAIYSLILRRLDAGASLPPEQANRGSFAFVGALIGWLSWFRDTSPGCHICR